MLLITFHMAAYHGKFLSLLTGPFDGIITLYVVTLKVAHFIIIFRNSGSSRSNGNNWVIPTQLDINNRRFNLDHVSISDKASHYKISQSLESATFVFKIV